MVKTQTDQAFIALVERIEPRLAVALAAGYGPEVGQEATRDALAYAWEHWSKVRQMENPAGYLFRVGQSKARRYLRRQVSFPPVHPTGLPHVEPGLPVALDSLTSAQRVAVVLIHAEGYTDREAADLMGVRRGTARKHAERAMTKLRTALEVTPDD